MFYRIDDFDEIDGPLFFRLATRAAAYTGVMAARIAKLQEQNPNVPQQGQGQQQQQPAKGTYSQAELGVSFPGMFSMGKAKGNGK